MSEQDLIRTIQFQQNEINQLKGQLARLQGINFQQKYRKALREIHGIINANRQLKEQLDKLKSFRMGEAETVNQIQKEEFNRTHEKLLKDKNQVYSEKEALQLENEKLRYSIAALEESVSKLKNDKMVLARQRQADQRFNEDKLSPEKNDRKNERDQGGYKDKETELRRTIQNYQQHHATISRANRHLEQQNNELQNKIFNMETQYKYKLNEKDIELKELKSIARQEYQGQIANLRKELAQSRLENSELSMKVQFYAEQSQNKYQSENLYQKQLLQTLRDLKIQMEPMSYQIAELQEKNQFEKEQSLREKTSMQLKVVEMQSELQRFKENQKILEQKLVRENEKNRKFQESEKTMRKLQEQNRMLGGRVIVLQSKEVALRNRNGDQLEERVMQFQTRVEMLLADKETIGNMKNVGIHQLIALKAYILQLDGRLKQVVNENQYAIKKYRSYKEKCAQLIRQLKQHDIAINSLKGKLQGYDRLVVKLQGQLERAITINDNQMKEFNMKISQTSVTSIQIYKKKYDALVEKLSLQEKYSEQQIETIKLNYQTKIVDLNLKLEELHQIKDTIGLYKSKNEQLSNKLLQKQNELIEIRMTKINIPDIVAQPKINTKEIIQKLHDTISNKQAQILKLHNQVKSIEIQWKSKYSQIEQSTSSAISKKSKMIEDKENTIADIEAQLKMLRKSNADMEATIFDLRSKQSKGAQQTVDVRKYQNVNSRITELEIELQSLQAKNQIEAGRINKLIKSNQQLTENNNNLEAEITRLKFEGKRIEKELKMELEEKDAEIRRTKLRVRENEEDSNNVIKSPQIDSYKINGLKMQLEMMESQYQQAESDKNRYYNRTIELEREVSALAIQVDELNYSLERSKNNATNEAILLQSQKDQQIQTLQYQLRNSSSRIRDLEEEVSSRENQLTKLKNEYGRERQRLMEENENKDEEINRVSRELSKLKFELNSQEDAQSGIRNQLQYKLNRLTHDNSSLRDQIQNLTNECSRLQSEVRFLKGREHENNNSLAGQEEYIIKLSNDIKNYQNRQADLEEQIRLREEAISKSRQEINYYKTELENANDVLASKDSYINKLNMDISGYRNKQIEWEMELQNKESARNRLQSQLSITKNQISGLEQEIQSLQRQVNRMRYSQSMNDQQTQGHQAIIEEKEMIISRLQGDLRIKSDHINELSEEIDNKNKKIAQLQNESVRYRSMSTDFESEMMEKNSQVSRLNFELNALKARFTDLQSETQIKDNNWHNLNRQLTTLKSQLDSFQSEMHLKDSNIDRFKREARQLGQQIQRLNDEVFSKNTQINQLNQQIFKIKMEGQDKSNEQVAGLENEIFRLRNKISSLEGDLEYKEEQLMRVKNDMSKIRATMTTNRYSDDEYDSLQNQFFQFQKTSAEAKRKLEESHQEQIRNFMRKQDSDKQIIQNLQFYKEGFISLEETIMKFNSSIERFFEIQSTFPNRGTFNENSYFSEIDEINDRKDKVVKTLSQLEQNIKEYSNKQGAQELWVEINLLREKLQQSEARATQNIDSEKQLQEKDWGLHLYTNQVDRLRNIEQELREEVESLKLRLNQYQNQQDRIVENLTIMTLTFAQVEALRERMISKEIEIKEVRKSLVNFAGSIQEINRRSSLSPENNTQTSIDNHPPTHGAIAIHQNNAGNKISMNYRETDGSTNRGTTSYNYQYEVRHGENYLKQQQNLQLSAEQMRAFGHNMQSLEQISSNLQQRRLASEQQQYIEENNGQILQSEGQNAAEMESLQNEERKGSAIEGLQEHFDSKIQENRVIDQHREEINMVKKSNQEATVTSNLVTTHQNHQGIIYHQQQINAQYSHQQPQHQIFTHGGPASHIIHQKPVLVSQRGAQPRVNFGGSVHSSFEQSRTISAHSSINQQYQYGQPVMRNPNPAFPMMNMSR